MTRVWHARLQVPSPRMCESGKHMAFRILPVAVVYPLSQPIPRAIKTALSKPDNENLIAEKIGYLLLLSVSYFD